MPHRLTVVVSQSRSQNPKKRALEEALVAELLGRPGVDVTVVPHLYDLKADLSETTNLADVEPRRFETTKKKMIALHAEIRAEGPEYELGRKKYSQ